MIYIRSDYPARERQLCFQFLFFFSIISSILRIVTLLDLVNSLPPSDAVSGPVKCNADFSFYVIIVIVKIN